MNISVLVHLWQCICRKAEVVETVASIAGALSQERPFHVIRPPGNRMAVRS